MISKKSNASERPFPDVSDQGEQELLEENRGLREKIARIEAELQSRKLRNKTLSSAINIGYLEWDETTKRPAFISSTMADIVGMSCESLYRVYQREGNFFRLIHPDDLQHYIDNLDAAPNPDHQGDSAHAFDYRILRPDGSIRYVRELRYGIQEEYGVVIRSYCAIQDLTEYHESMRAHRESEQRYSSLFAKLPLGVQEQDWSAIKKAIDKLQAEEEIARRTRERIRYRRM